MTSAIRLPYLQNTPEWLEARLNGITGSDAAIIAGERGSMLELWAYKTRRLVEPQPEPGSDLARLFEWGHRLEPVIAEWYTDTTGRRVRRVNHLLQHPEVPWALVSLDREVVGERRVVELKTDRYAWWGFGEPVPGSVQAQVQHQLWVTGYPVADVAVLTAGSDPRIIEIPRDQDFIDNLVFLEEVFWDWVQRGVQPPVDGTENTRNALNRLHPKDDGIMLPPWPEVVDLAGQLAAARAAKKQADADEATLSNAIRALVADAAGVEGVLTLRNNKPSARIHWEEIANDYRAFLEKNLYDVEWLDRVAASHTEAVQGPRVLRLLKEKS